ncbi:ankyrin and armadillo repeat-containing protein-like [Haliotis asinina]|uniref:ankyrin and armadillo repeat-containing protein-like n=1 Tax=Haliotis asinina TaxID=109174 RepID=UPI0035323260
MSMNKSAMPNPKNDQGPSEEDILAQQSARQASNYFEKFDRYDCQELLAHSSTHWMLSNEDFRLPTDPPVGLITNINPTGSNHSMILFPEDADVAENQPLDYRELHQIVKELTYGIFVMHQTPLIALEANYDKSTSCQLPPAYLDTKVGQVLVSVDYMLKALWHGAYIPKDKRIKFSERWRSNLDIDPNGNPETKKPLLTEFTSAGLMDITKDPDYSTAYDNLPVEQPGDTDMIQEGRFFMSHVDELTMRMTFSQNAVSHHKDMYIVDADWAVSSIVKLLDDRIDHTGYERIKTRLQLHEEMIKTALPNKLEIKRQIELLKFISFMTPFLIGLKKRMRIPNINRLLPSMAGDECRTERDLPPLILGQDFKCKNFSFGNHYFHLHGGILFDLETSPMEEAGKEFSMCYEAARSEALTYLYKLLEPDQVYPEHTATTMVEINGKRYHVLTIELETYYGQNPHKPLWVRSYSEAISGLKPKKLPINDINLHEQFKKYFGYKKAIKYKSPVSGLKAAAQRGLVAMFMTLCRKMPASRLGKQDEHGLSLLHHAAMNNRPQVIAILLLQSMDVNVRRNNILSTGPTALHVAARCGALDAVSCLLSNYANILATDQDGWAPIHHAAFFDHESIIRLMIRKNTGLLELTTKNEMRSSPLLLAASSGALSAVQCLILLGADITKMDGDNNGMVNLAALRFHTNILEYLIEWSHPDVPVWEILVAMLNSESLMKKDSAVKCLEVLSTSKEDHWKAILNAGGVQALVNLLNLNNEEVQSVAASVLCNISEQNDIRLALTTANAGPILIQLLSSPVDDIQSRAAIILSDLACVQGNQEVIAENDGIPPLVNLLDSELEDVLVNAVNAIRVLCVRNPHNQTAVAECGGIEPLIEFLSVDSETLQAATAAAIAAMTTGHRENQDAIMAERAAKPLVELIKLNRNVTVQVKAASALEALADNNSESQAEFLALDAPKALLRLLKNINIEVREQGACALWALAGHTKTQQKNIAQRIGIPHIIQMLLEPTEKLLYVGCMTSIALGRESMENQNALAKADAFQQLVRLLRSNKTSDRVLLMVIKVLGTLCVGVANRNNKLTQRKIAEEGGIPILVQILLSPPSEEIHVEVAHSLACVVLSNHDNQEKLQEEQGFKFDILLDLLKSSSEEIRLKAGMALTTFAFNNTPQQFAIREAGGIKFSVFEPFIKSGDEYYQCSAAFQIVVLARVIVDQDQVLLTARGITELVKKLTSEDENTVVIAASLLSSLAHTRAGIPDAMITTGAIELLVERLWSKNDLVRNAVAVALGYLTYNKTAARDLLSKCRRDGLLYKQLMANIGNDPRISQEFVDDFRRAKIVGLPSQCLEISSMGLHSRASSRPRTTQSGGRLNSQGGYNRIKSAPPYVHQRKSVTSVAAKPTDESGRKSTLSTRPSTSSTRITENSGSFKTQLKSWKKKN